MIRVKIDKSWGVYCRTEIVIPMRQSAIWGQLRAFRHFVTLDPFHHRVESEDVAPCVGMRFRLIHAFGPIRLVRAGRILKWREGCGYAFSDLSLRGVDRGFPHTYDYELTDGGTDAGRIALVVRGRWTARWIPRSVVRVWLYCVMRSATASIRNALLAVRATQVESSPCASSSLGVLGMSSAAQGSASRPPQ